MFNPLLFSSEKFYLRTLVINCQPWFVAADVCEALTIKDKRKWLTRLDADEKDISSIDGPRGRKMMMVVNESGLYNLIFSRRKNKAKNFKRWVITEVFPAIRKSGGNHV